MVLYWERFARESSALKGVQKDGTENFNAEKLTCSANLCVGSKNENRGTTQGAEKNYLTSVGIGPTTSVALTTELRRPDGSIAIRPLKKREHPRKVWFFSFFKAYFEKFCHSHV